MDLGSEWNQDMEWERKHRHTISVGKLSSGVLPTVNFDSAVSSSPKRNRVVFVASRSPNSAKVGFLVRVTGIE
jgi:hypothetical protein